MTRTSLSRFCRNRTKILENEDVTGRAFLKTTKNEVQSYGIKSNPATILVDFAKECKEKKLRSFSSYLSLSEVENYGLDSDGMDSISLFSLQAYEIQEDNKVYKRCIGRNFGQVTFLWYFTTWYMRNEYVVALLHAGIHIVMDETD